MLFLYCILFIEIILLYSHEITNISPYEHKTVRFTTQKPYNIFKYSLKTINNIEKSYLSIRSIDKNVNQDYLFYVYLDKENITEINGEFSNYEKYGKSNNNYTFKDCINHDYYIVIKYSASYDKTDTFYFYSTDSPYEIKNVFYQDYLVPDYNDDKAKNYIFSFSSNYTKYIHFGLANYYNYYENRKSLTIIQKDKDNTVLYKSIDNKYASSFSLKKNTTYYFNFSLFYSSSSKFYLYLMESNYSKIIEITKNKKDFDYLPVINEIYILIDVSSISDGNKITFEYNYEWFYVNFRASGFLTDNKEDIDDYISKGNYYITSMGIDVEKEKCKEGICKGYLEKRFNLKKIVLKIPSGSESLQYIKFRYGKEKFVFKKHFIFPLLLGLILALPNILFQIIRKLKSKMTAPACSVIMNFFINIAYGNIIGFFIGVGEIDSFFIGLGFFAFFFILCLCNLMPVYRSNGAFSVITNLCHKIEKKKSLDEMVSINRKLCPDIRVYCVAQHQESREVWEEYESYESPVYKTVTTTDFEGNQTTEEVLDHYETNYRHIKTYYSEWGRVDQGGGVFKEDPVTVYDRIDKNVEYKTVVKWKKELEYKYKSWQDNTENINNVKYCSIIKANFTYKIFFDQESTNQINKMKKELYDEGITYDTDVKTNDIFTVPEFHSNHTCLLNESEYEKIQRKYGNACGYIFWFLLFILGYSSILEAYSRYETGQVQILIKKYVSSQDNQRMPFKQNEVDLPGITISFVHTDIKMKSLEKKLKKGKIEKKDLDIPLIIVN